MAFGRFVARRQRLGARVAALNERVRRASDTPPAGANGRTDRARLSYRKGVTACESAIGNRAMLAACRT
jgi:hypothetical protein